MLEESLTFAEDNILEIITTELNFNIELNKKIKIWKCTAKQMEQISVLSTPSTFLIVLKQNSSTLISDYDKFLILDGIQDPGNLGTIIRTCDWFGINHLICSQDTVEVYNPKVVQSSMGSIFRINVSYLNIIEFIKSSRVLILGTELNAVSIYLSLDKLKSAKGIVIGSEGNGIRQEILDLLKDKITIPRNGNSESLNAAVSTGIILSYWTR